MDPNTALARLREAIARWSSASDADTRNDAASDAADWADALDDWISKGGFLPTAWARDPMADTLLSWWRGLTPEEREMTGVDAS